MIEGIDKTRQHEISDHLSPAEVEQIVDKINDPRLTADHPEYFIIDMGDFKRYVQKHRFIQEIQDSGHVINVKVEEVLRRNLQKADEIKNRQV
jgi:hypothetical protein